MFAAFPGLLARLVTPFLRLVRLPRALALGIGCAAASLSAHPVNFSSTITYSATQPAGGADSIAQWSGAAFDAANIGGSGVNADGGANNGSANDGSTYVANNRPTQGQTFTTGSNPLGYDFTAVTVRMTGYTNNTASGSNAGGWNLNLTNGPIQVTIGRVGGTTSAIVSIQNFNSGGTGNPGSGATANGPGTYLTFNLPFAVHLDPDTTYGFDLWIGNGGSNYFEWLGLGTHSAADPYPGGTAYTRSGNTLTPLAGDRVFMAHLTARDEPAPAFAHPGTIHTAADLQRMRDKIVANAEPWASSFATLGNSPWAQTWWPAYDIDWIVRGGSAGNNYTRTQQDAQAIYELALRWHLTGDTAYADHAVHIANVWSGLTGVTGDSNAGLAVGICGYLFAIGGELLSTYPGWPEPEKQAYKDMMMRVFYAGASNFLWWHYDTFWRTGGNTHYRLNWDTANMACVAAIGVLCDNRAVYEQGLDYFKHGVGTGRVERAVWYIHPGGLGQGEEAGRDQPHNLGGWHAMALLCQTAWNQGDDLFGYDNNRVLRAWEYNAKYNLGHDVPYARHRNSDLTYTEGSVSGAGRGLGYFQYELVFGHYAHVKGIAAPWSKLARDATRPEPRPNTAIHPSQVDWLGLGSLTYARDDVAADIAPSGLRAHWSKNRIILDWWGSARATSYAVKRATSAAGPYTTLGTVTGPDLNFTDTSVANESTYFYVVTATTPGGELDSEPLRVARELVTHYTFEGTPADVVGTRDAELRGGTTAPGFTTGFGGGQALALSGASQYAQLPTGTGNHQDITIAVWVYWTGGPNWQRIFDFGSEIEATMYLTPSNGGGGVEFGMTTTRGGNFEGDASYYLRGSALPTNQWVHLAVSLNGDTCTLYVNGVPHVTKTIDLIDPLFSQPFCYLGRSMYNGDAYFQGRLDDFRIYNYGLTGDEIYALWGQSTNAAPVFGGDPINLPAAIEDAAYGFSPGGETLAAYATDANGGTLTFAKLTGPSWLTVAANGALGGTPGNADVGENRFTVRVTDGSGATDDADLVITVNNTNDAPTWSAASLTRAAVTRDQPYHAGITLATDVSDLDAAYGEILTISKLSGPAWLAVATDGALSGTPGASDVGANTFTVRVTDTAGAFADATLTITVYPFEQRAGFAFEDDLADTLGNYAATSTGSPAFGTGRVGRGLIFDGVDDTLTLPAGVADSQDLTVAAWVYWNGGAANQRVFDFGNDTDQYLFLTPSNGSTLRFAIKHGGSEQQLNTTPLATARWVHLAVTLSGDTGRLYVNGVLVATNAAMTINPSDFRPTVNFIGDSQWSADPIFNGRIDDFRIYNHALAASDIAALVDLVPAVPLGFTATPRTGRIDLVWGAAQGATTYTVKRALVSGGPYTTVADGVTGTTYADSAVTNGTPYYYVVSATNAKGESADSAEVTAIPSDLLAHLKFDDAAGLTATDSSGNGWDAALVNAPAWTAGHLRHGLEFAATANQHATLPAGIVSGLTDFTVSTWVKVNAFATWQRIFDFGTGTTNYMFLSTQYTGTAPNAAKLRFGIRTPSVGEQGVNGTSIALTADVWTHVAVTRSGNTVSLYINGALAGSGSVTLAPSALGQTTQNYLGKSQWPDPYLNGALDDFRIYSRALGAEELVALANPATESPASLSAIPANGGATLSWPSGVAATSYTLSRANVSGGPYTIVADGITALTYSDTGLTNGVTYHYVVRAVGSSGESADSPEASVTPSTLHLRYRLDETEGATVADSGGRGQHGAAVNAPAWTTGRLDGGLSLASAASQHVALPAGVVAGLTDCTIMTWVNIASLANWQRIFDFGTGTDNYLFLAPQTGANPNRLRFAIRTPGVAEQIIVSSTAIPVGSWAHVAVVFSGTTARLYLNGALVGQNTAMTLTPASLGTTTQNYLGRSQFAADPHLTATLDDFRIYSEALTTADIALFASPLSAPQNLAATPGPLELTLAWDPVPGATRYTVKYATTSGGPYTVLSAGLPDVERLHSALSYGTTYHYVVSAGNAAYDGPDSAELAATPESALLDETEATPPSLVLMPAVGDLPAMAKLTTATSVAGHVYQLQTTTDLATGGWLDVGEPVVGDGEPIVFETPYDPAEPRRFYRVLVGR